MTVRHFGRQAAAARPSAAVLALMLALSAPALAAAQQEETPAPSSSAPVFRLPPAAEGRSTGVQGPSDNGLPPLAPGERRGALPSGPAPTPAPTPSLTPPAVTPPRPAAAQPVRQTPAPAPTTAQPARRAAPPATAPTSTSAPTSGSAPAAAPPAADGGALTLPGFTSDPTAPAVEGAQPAAAPVEPAPVPAAPAGNGGVPIWAWLAAALAAAGAGFWYWRRRLSLAAAAPVEPAAAPARPAPVPRAPTPTPTPTPSAPPRPAQPAPSPLPRAAAAPPAAAPSPLVTRPLDERRAQVAMALEIRDIRLTPDQLVVSFALNLTNQGPVEATGMMVRIALGQGSAMPEPVLSRFFDGAGGSVLRDDMVLAPGAGEQLTTEVMLPRAAVEPLVIGGKPVLIPVIAFDVTYHWDGPGEAFGQNAGSFVLGREQGASGSEKLAPLPFDRPMLVIDRPAARTTAVRRVQ